MKRYSLYSIAAVLLIALVWVGCSTTDRGPVAPNAIGVASKPAAGAIAAQNRHTDRLLAIRGVVGTAVGEREDGSPSIKVFIERAGIAGIPADLEGVPVDVEVTGKIVALARPGGGSSVNPASRFPRPVPIGVSTGHPDITAGTIGCRVKDALGNVYALSNNHVYANQNDALIGDSALQPGTYDGGVNPDDAIGNLANYVPIDFSGGDNTVDAAIALSDLGRLGRSTPSNGYGTPKSATAAAVINLGVMKYGRTTSQTKGKVYALNATVNVGYDEGRVAKFVNQIIIIPGNFSAGGDSGSLIVVEKGTNARKPVGLLFAGSNTVTIANPIDAVLGAFNVTVDGE